MTDYSIVRDYWERPFVTSDGGPLRFEKGRKSPINAEAYTRISTLAGALDDKGGLIDWSSARAMIGTVKSAAISAQLAHLISAHEDPWAAEEGKKPLKALVKRAQELGGSEDAAGLGTAFHGLCEQLDKTGAMPEYVPRHLIPWVEARQAALAEWEPLHIEPFVVCDELRAAGSPDRYLRHKLTGLVVCADDKTGTSEPDFGLKVTVQVAIGSRAVLYDQSTGNRTPIECAQNVGLMIHTPIRDTVPRSDLYVLDLNVGWRLANLAVEVREARKFPKLKRMPNG